MSKRKQKRAEMPFYTYTGQMVDLNDLEKSKIDFEHIAHALAQQCRYNGATSDFYSVAEHTVLLAEYAEVNYTGDDPDNLVKGLLLHDASEAYIGDIVYHLKGQLPAYKDIEARIQDRIFTRFGLTLSKEEEKEIHRLDRSICIDEMYQLMPYIDPVLFSMGHQPLKITVSNWTPVEAEQKLMAIASRYGLI